jgi:hypothetical protein
MQNTKTNKSKSKKHARPFHLHLESFFRLRVCLVLAAGLLMLALARSERDMLLAAPQAYAEGVSYVGSHLSEERLHPHHTLHILRPPTIASGR